MKILKKAIAVLLCGVVLTVSPVTVLAADNAVVKKDESVYLILNDDGSINQQIVSVWLHSQSGLQNVKDVSNLINIQDIKSNLEPVISGEFVNWATEDTDVYYKGNSTDTPLIDVEITYTLNGSQIAAKDLIGKSGDVAIKISLKNNLMQTRTINGEQRTIFTPLFAAVILDLPTAVFSNVNAPNTMIMTEGTNQIVAMLAMPGLSDSFSGVLDTELKDIKAKFNGEFTITAKAEDFKFPMMMGGAATKFSGLGEISGLADTTGILKSMNTLLKAIDIIGDGTSTLSDVLGLVKENKGEFSEGIVQAADGIMQLSSGINQLSDAANLLKDKVNNELIPGISEADNTKKELLDKLTAVEQLYKELNIPEIADIQTELTGLISDVCNESSDATIKALTGKTYSQLTAAEKLKISAARTQVKLNANTKILSFISSLNTTKLVQLITKLKDLETSASTMLGGMDTLVKSLYNPNDDINNPTSLSTAILAFSMGIDKLDTGFNGFSNKILKTAGAKIKVEELKTAMEIKDAMIEQAGEYTSYSGTPENSENSLKFIIKVNEPETSQSDDETPAVKTEVKLSLWDKIVRWFTGLFKKS